MDKQKEKLKNNVNDFSKTLLDIEENDKEKIEKIDESIEKEKQGVGLDEFVVKNKWQVYKDLVDVFKERNKNDNDLKKKYSKTLIKILISQLIIMNIIFVLKGLNILHFSDTTFNIFISATIAEVFTLVTIIVRYLFTDNLTELLKNLLSGEENKNESKKD